MSSTSSRSASPAPPPPPAKAKKSKSSSHKSAKRTQADVDNRNGKNEGTDPHWAFKPPAGSVLLDHDVDCEDFDWDAVKDDDELELWLVRVPDGVKTKHLETLQLDAPSSRTARIGGITRKAGSFDVWNVVEDSAAGGSHSAPDLGGEEIRSLSCLLPRKRKGGKLYIAPKAITRHIIISPEPVQPTPAQPASSSAPSSSHHNVYQNPPRPSYPDEVLKHRFMPYGSLAPAAEKVEAPSSVAMDVDEKPESPVQTKPKEGKEKKVKKRKGEKGEGEVATLKKSKKVKVAL